MMRFLYRVLTYPLITTLFREIYTALARLTAWILLSDNLIVSVFTRGSTYSQNFVPLFSDLDIAIVLRARREPYRIDELKRTQRRFQVAKVLNPFIQDWWQTWILESELPLFAHYWYVYDTPDWRLLSGKEFPRQLSPIDSTVFAATTWFQELMWFQTALWNWPQIQRSAKKKFGTSMRKVAIFSERLRFFARYEGDHTSPAIYLDWKESYLAKKYYFWSRKYEDNRSPEIKLAECLRNLDSDARLLSKTFLLTLEKNTEDFSKPRDVGHIRNPEKLSELQKLSLDRDCDLVFEDYLGLHLVLSENSDTRLLENTYMRLSELSRSLKQNIFLYTTDVYRWASLMDERSVIFQSPKAIEEGLANCTPYLLKKQLIYRLMYLGSYTRLIISSSDLHILCHDLFWKLLQMSVLYQTGRLVRSRAALCEASGKAKAYDLLRDGSLSLEEVFRLNSSLYEDIFTQLWKITA